MDRIRQLRKERGLSQAKLAVMADMDPATLNRLEQGKGNPNLKTLERVADALGVEVADLFPKAARRSSLEPSLLNGLEEERHSPLSPWAEHIRRMAARIRQQADDPHSPHFRDPWAALLFVEWVNHESAQLYFFLLEEEQEAYGDEDISALNEVMLAFEELIETLSAAQARADQMGAERAETDLDRLRRLAAEATQQREQASARFSARLESRGA